MSSLAHLLGLTRRRPRAAQPKSKEARSQRTPTYDFGHLAGLAPATEHPAATEPQSVKLSPAWAVAFRRLQQPLAPKAAAADAVGRSWDEAFRLAQQNPNGG